MNKGQATLIKEIDLREFSHGDPTKYLHNPTEPLERGIDLYSRTRDKLDFLLHSPEFTNRPEDNPAKEAVQNAKTNLDRVVDHMPEDLNRFKEARGVAALTDKAFFKGISNKVESKRASNDKYTTKWAHEKGWPDSEYK
jgi:hypothetical protein